MSIDSDSFVSVIVPLHNDAALVREFVAECYAMLKSSYENFEILLIDDGSTDQTKSIIDAILKEFECLRYQRLSRHFGTEIAIAAGLETAIGDYIVVALPAFDPVDKIPELVRRSQETGAIIVGRTNSIKYSKLYRLVYKMFYAFCNRFLSLRLVEDTTYFLVLGRPMLNSIIQIKDKFRYIKSFATFVGYKTIYYDYTLAKRGGKDLRRGFFEAINLGIDLMVSNSIRPLRLVSFVGLIASGINFSYFGYIALIAFFKKNVAEGWITLSTQIAFGFFMLSLVLTVICEYIGRILIESRDRPFYFVLEEKNSSVLIANKDNRINVVGSSLSSVNGERKKDATGSGLGTPSGDNPRI